MNLARIINDINVGNSCNTYFKGFGERTFCVAVGQGHYLRDTKQRVRRFSSRKSAERAAISAGYSLYI